MRVVVLLVVSTVVLASCKSDRKLIKEAPKEVAPGPTGVTAPGTALTTTTLQYLGADTLRVGDCVDQPSEDVLTVRAIPCSKRHHSQVTDLVDLSRYGERYPSEDEFERIRANECMRAFEQFTGHGETADLEVRDFVPTAEGWRELKQRTVVCVAEATREGNVLVGSVKKR